MGGSEKPEQIEITMQEKCAGMALLVSVVREETVVGRQSSADSVNARRECSGAGLEFLLRASSREL
jgi:hypothetical protein